ncbi:hypothetical protein HFO56_34160 [Rhizobium laguerreae]|uniref:hypothetical protein n=1 Tax=Rhizobium laguerreae TaxID=1076926 RepID=UPI001C8FD422|nr:hypothetical protein [Rhizobium laguerreae]MBY3157372.1 hypothetical protein [Rhizobium laguerreae]
MPLRSSRWNMSEDQIDAHLAFLTRIGISERDVRTVRSMMLGVMGEDNVAIFSPLIPLLPVDLAIRMIEGERHGMEVRPHLWDGTRRPWLVEHARFFDTAAIIMDMRVAGGDVNAARGAIAMREFSHYLDNWQRGLEADPDAF